MLSFVKFLNYLNENPNTLSQEQKESLHNILFCQTNDRYIYPNIISKSLQIKKSFGKDILLYLSNFLDEKLIYNCPNCNMDQIYIANSACKNCGTKITPFEDNIALKVSGLLSDSKKILDNEETVREEQLNQILSVWTKQKFIIYLLIDISNSECIQNENDSNYIEYLKTLRSVIKMVTARTVKGSFLYFGEIGDCFKIALSDTDDVMPFLRDLAKTHFLYFKDKKYPSSVEGLNPYPCLKISAQVIELLNKNPKDLLCKTLNNSLDFNYSQLTKLFRLDGKIKLNYKNVFSEKNKTCVWIFDNLANKIGLAGKSIKINASKHKDVVSESEVIGLIYPDGIENISEDPNSLLEAGVAGGA